MGSCCFCLKSRFLALFRSLINLVASSANVNHGLKITNVQIRVFSGNLFFFKLFIITVNFLPLFPSSLLEFSNGFDLRLKVFKILGFFFKFLGLFLIGNIGCVRIKSFSHGNRILNKKLLEVLVQCNLFSNRTAARCCIKIAYILLRGTIPDTGREYFVINLGYLCLNFLESLWIS